MKKFLVGRLQSDLAKWCTKEDKTDCSNLWTKLQKSYPYLDQLMTSTTNMSELWRYKYFYHVLQYGKQISTADLMCISNHLQAAETKLRERLILLNSANIKIVTSPYKKMVFDLFSIKNYDKKSL